MDFIRFLFIPHNDLLTLSSNSSPPHMHIHRDLEAGGKRAKEKGKQKLGLSPSTLTHSLLVHSQTHTPGFLLKDDFFYRPEQRTASITPREGDVKYCNLVIKVPAKM